MQGIDHRFRDERLLALALTHASCDGAANNERLEFLGDAVLDLVVAEALFEREPTLDEGRMTRLKADVVSRRTLARPAQRLGLEALARLGPGLRGRAQSVAVLANLYEALVGAVHRDGGYAEARAFVRATLAEELARALEDASDDHPKQRLQMLCQARGEPSASGGLPSSELPVYELVETRGAAHERAFLVAARIGSRTFPPAWGRTMKEAESWAAHEALLELESRPARPSGEETR